MDKHARELIIFERIVGEKKVQAKYVMIFGIPLTLILGGVFIPYLTGFEYSRLTIVLYLLVLGLIIAGIIMNYVRINTKIKTMIQAVGANSDEEMEDILEDCLRIKNSIFINNKYLINFDSFIVTQLCDIKSVKKYTCNGESSSSYGLKIKVKKGRNDDIMFDFERDCDEMQKVITTASGFAEDID